MVGVGWGRVLFEGMELGWVGRGVGGGGVVVGGGSSPCLMSVVSTPRRRRSLTSGLH